MPAILSGPSFAADVARGLPTAVTLAAADEAVAAALAQALTPRTFRPYHSTDVRGVEIGGAAKNVLAIAAGIVTGRGLGASASAALTTRGFAELVRFGRALRRQDRNHDGPVRPGRSDPDLLEPQSRNFSFGVALGKGEAADTARARQACRRRLHRAGAAGDGARQRMSTCRSRGASPRCWPGQMSVDEAIESLLTRPARNRRNVKRWPTG